MIKSIRVEYDAGKRLNEQNEVAQDADTLFMRKLTNVESIHLS